MFFALLLMRNFHPAQIKLITCHYYTISILNYSPPILSLTIKQFMNEAFYDGSAGNSDLKSQPSGCLGEVSASHPGG